MGPLLHFMFLLLVRRFDLETTLIGDVTAKDTRVVILGQLWMATRPSPRNDWKLASVARIVDRQEATSNDKWSGRSLCSEGKIVGCGVSGAFRHRSPPNVASAVANWGRQ